MWLSVISGALAEPALSLLSDAAPEYFWSPLRAVYDGFASMAAGPDIGSEEASFVAEVLAVHRWQDAAEALRRALAKSPFAFRRIINGATWPPRPDGRECPLSGLWLYPGPLPSPSLLFLCLRDGWRFLFIYTHSIVCCPRNRSFLHWHGALPVPPPVSHAGLAH